jgi:hypothetical protein
MANIVFNQSMAADLRFGAETVVCSLRISQRLMDTSCVIRNVLIQI